jgi:hypothetical protein
VSNRSRMRVRPRGRRTHRSWSAPRSGNPGRIGSVIGPPAPGPAGRRPRTHGNGHRKPRAVWPEPVLLGHHCSTSSIALPAPQD